ncbi:damage-inducible protein [Acetobacter musti]|uniref:Damage-inducible protein n=1 Tax=Acetobacter musti TaxID=864732 RepID=A0ABX0JPE1_9PROT|nr:damage-inducible protein [Acetobacter musti]NHN84366.1 damage-inducible protein [Acetobacter musti]
MTISGPRPALGPALATLRDQISRLEGHAIRRRAVLPFGVDEIDRHLPGGGLVCGALHEVSGGNSDAVHAAAAGQFSAGIVARMRGRVLWIVTGQDLFAPALRQAGLSGRRLICAQAGSDADVLACFEEGLRYGGLGAVVGEVGRLSMMASRRLQLAAEKSGTMGIAIRRCRYPPEMADFGQPVASVTRWRVSVRPSAVLPVPGVGRSRWRLELMRVRSGEPAVFEVEACDDRGRLASCRLALSAALADGPAQEATGFRSARA